ncbi:MAG: hypothetical protein OEY52_17230 [Gammaproteobacteria bacterium]|nr:hypothetical protein [Gammaproteobacteria bacterium]
MLFRFCSLIVISLLILTGCDIESSPGPITIGAAAEENIDFATYPPLSVPIYVYRVADDDGSNASYVTTTLVDTWLVGVNEYFAKANITFTFDALNDFETVNNSLLNLGSSLSQNFLYSDLHPGHIVIFFRKNFYVDHANPGGYVSVYAGGPDHLSHELGHVFWLGHTFGKKFTTIEEAINYFAFTAYDLSLFDGDGIPDTAPDPYLDNFLWFNHVNQADGTLKINEITFQLPHDNLMSYYFGQAFGVTERFTIEQADRMREALVIRFGPGLTSLVPGTIKQGYEAELLTVVSGSNYLVDAMQDLNLWSNDRILLWQPVTVGQELELSFNVGLAGTYTIYMGHRLSRSNGIVRYSINGSVLTKSYDNFLTASSDANLPSTTTGPTPIGTFDLIAGANTLKIIASGKNARSKGMNFGLDYVVIAQ